jgi:hypothetical protein
MAATGNIYLVKVSFWRRQAATSPPTRDQVVAMMRELRREQAKLDRYEASFNKYPSDDPGAALLAGCLSSF